MTDFQESVFEQIRPGMLYHIDTKWNFRCDQGIYPVVPFKKKGEIWHPGWDIPTRWAVDANGQAWMDNAHGATLNVVVPEYLCSTIEDEHERREIQKLLGLTVDKPSWVVTALQHGWTPPEGFVY